MSAAHAVAVPQERLACHAQDRRPSARVGTPCGQFLGYAPAPARFVEVADRAPDSRDGRLWVRCSRCKAWNVFEDVG